LAAALRAPKIWRTPTMPARSGIGQLAGHSQSSVALPDGEDTLVLQLVFMSARSSIQLLLMRIGWFVSHPHVCTYVCLQYM
jgi:hypothetical protein